MSEHATDTVARLDDIAELYLRINRAERQLFANASPELQVRIRAIKPFMAIESDTVAEALHCLADEIQAECDDAAADSHKDAA